jgi:hypothetical protein
MHELDGHGALSDGRRASCSPAHGGPSRGRRGIGTCCCASRGLVVERRTGSCTARVGLALMSELRTVTASKEVTVNRSWRGGLGASRFQKRDPEGSGSQHAQPLSEPGRELSDSRPRKRAQATRSSPQAWHVVDGRRPGGAATGRGARADGETHAVRSTARSSPLATGRPFGWTGSSCGRIERATSRPHLVARARDCRLLSHRRGRGHVLTGPARPP